MRASEIRIIKFVTNFDLVNKFEFENIYCFPNFDKLIVNLNIQDQDSFNSSFYPRSLLLLELLTGHKSIVSAFKKSLKGKKTYKVLFSGQVTLRSRYFFHFIYLLSFFIMPAADRKFLRYNKHLSFRGNYYFSIKDVAVLPGMLENFFKWPYPVNFYVIGGRGNSILLLKYLFDSLGFFLDLQQKEMV